MALVEYLTTPEAAQAAEKAWQALINQFMSENSAGGKNITFGELKELVTFAKEHDGLTLRIDSSPKTDDLMDRFTAKDAVVSKSDLAALESFGKGKNEGDVAIEVRDTRDGVLKTETVTTGKTPKEVVVETDRVGVTEKVVTDHYGKEAVKSTQKGLVMENTDAETRAGGFFQGVRESLKLLPK